MEPARKLSADKKNLPTKELDIKLTQKNSVSFLYVNNLKEANCEKNLIHTFERNKICNNKPNLKS